MQPLSSRAGYAATNRSAFVNKVFVFFALALLVASLGAYGGFLLFQTNSELLLHPLVMFGSFAATLILAFTTHLWQERTPMNYLLFTLFALIIGFSTAPLLIIVGLTAGVGLIFKALISATCVFGAAAIFGAISNKDMSSLGGMLMISILGILIMGVINIFLGSTLLDMLLSGASILLFTGFTAYDMQMIKNHYADTMYVAAAMSLFIDFIGLFRSILQLLWAFSND